MHIQIHLYVRLIFLINFSWQVQLLKVRMYVFICDNLFMYYMLCKFLDAGSTSEGTYVYTNTLVCATLYF